MATQYLGYLWGMYPKNVYKDVASRDVYHRATRHEEKLEIHYVSTIILQ